MRREDVAADAAVTATPGSSLPPSEPSAVAQRNNIVEVKDIFKPKVSVEDVLDCRSTCVQEGLLTCHLCLHDPEMLKQRTSSERTHETYRLLRRKNMIVEAVHNFKIIDSLFQSVHLDR